MKTGTKVLVFGLLPLVVIGGGIFAYIYSRKGFKWQSPTHKLASDEITEDQFSRLVQSAQSSPEPNWLKGMSSIKLDAIFKKAKSDLTSEEIETLIPLYATGEKNLSFLERKTFDKLSNKIKVNFLN